MTPLAERIAAALADYDEKHPSVTPVTVIRAEVHPSDEAPGGTGWSVFLFTGDARLEVPIRATDHVASAIGATVH